MEQNRSLAISNKIHECKAGDIIGLLAQEFPHSIIESFQNETSTRDRVFSISNTLLTMVMTSVQKDKTLKNSVDLFYFVHQKRKQNVSDFIEKSMAEQKEMDSKILKKTAGRPKKYKVVLPKSIDTDISLNTAAYSKARGRVPVKLTTELFNYSRINEPKNQYTHWHGYRVFIGDGTYLQMQDTESIRADYEVKYNGIASQGFPQGLLEVIIERGTGQLYSFKLSNRHVSELALFYDMLDELPPKSIVLLDDLYNCYEIISKCRRLGIEIVVPAKRERNFEIVEKIGAGDAIIKIKTPKSRSKWLDKNEKAGDIILRRIECKSPEGNDYILLTTLLDKKITREEIHLFYLTRWDIEIGIREIKTIMDINVIRSKTPDMVMKELTIALATYNLIRKIIYASIKDLPFFPKEDLILEYYSSNKNLCIDKKGRVYNRWSTGRRATKSINTDADITKAQTQ